MCLNYSDRMVNLLTHTPYPVDDSFLLVKKHDRCSGIKNEPLYPVYEG